MVLEDIDPSANGFNDNPYPSESDPYANPTSSSRPSYDFNTLPAPLPVLGPVLGFHERRLRYNIDATLKFAAYRIRRPLTPDESQALATHLCSIEQSKSYFAATGLALGTWRWYTTTSVNRYPFYLPKPESVDPNKFAFIKGPAAYYARHTWRFLLYYSVASKLGSLVGQLVAQPIAAQRSAQDPRLAQFSRDLHVALVAERKENAGLRERVEHEMKELKGAREAAAQEAGRSSGRDPRPRGSWTAPKASPVDDDDMSPTAGNDPWPSAASDSWADPGTSSDAAPKSRAREQAPEGDLWGRQPTQPADDDASPTRGPPPTEDQAPLRPGESAWERLRRGGAPPPSQQRSTGTPQSSQRGQGDESFFSGAEDERWQSRERAQREFDARIERERQGKDFEEERKW